MYMLCKGGPSSYWRSGMSHGQLPKVAAQLQGMQMGLLAAQQLGFHSIVVQAPNSRPLLQVRARAMPDFLE